MTAGAQRPLRSGDQVRPGEWGAFCSRGYRRIRRANFLAGAAGAAVVVGTLAYYFIDLEPVIRGFSRSFDESFTLLMVVMLGLGYSQIPLHAMTDRQPRSIARAPGGLVLRYDRWAWTVERRIPWDNVRRVQAVGEGSAAGPRSYTIQLVPGKHRWYTHTVTVDAEVVRSWAPFLPERLRPALARLEVDNAPLGS